MSPLHRGLFLQHVPRPAGLQAAAAQQSLVPSKLQVALRLFLHLHPAMGIIPRGCKRIMWTCDCLHWQSVWSLLWRTRYMELLEQHLVSMWNKFQPAGLCCHTSAQEASCPFCTWQVPHSSIKMSNPSLR